MKLKSEDLPRYNELIQSQKELSDLQVTHQRGSLSMARGQSLNSASAQFYISLRSLPELDGRYTVFGKLVKGVSLLDEIKEGDFIVKIKPLLD